MTPRLATAALAATVVLAACASKPPPNDDVGRAPALNEQGLGGPHGPRRLVFISPAGEPFRAEGPQAIAPVTQWFTQADTDHDGALSRAEFIADFERFFRRLDANGDGVIDGFEAQAYERNVAPELIPEVGRLRSGEGQDERLFQKGGGGDGRARMGRGEPRRRGGRTNGVPQGASAYQFFPDPEPVTSADRDLDGRVTMAEWRVKAAATFAQLDKFSAGRITLSELPSTPQQAAIDRRKAGGKRPPS